MLTYYLIFDDIVPIILKEENRRKNKGDKINNSHHI
jgi:hypothetical protein